MKKLFTFLFLIQVFNFFSQADSVITALPKDTTPVTVKDTSWKTNGFIGLNLSQTSLNNWQGGGEDNFAVTSIFNFEAKYTKNENEWATKVDAQYGLIRNGNASIFKKNADQLFGFTKYSLHTSKKHFFYTLTADFRSQFSPGYNYYADSIAPGIVSNFMAPAYIQLCLGMDYKIEDYFSLTVAPLAGKVTIVNDRGLADAGAFGVEAAKLDTAGNVITPGQKIRYEFGGRITIRFKKDLSKFVNLDTYADFFSSYGNNPQNVDVVWNTLMTLKINKVLSATFSCKMVYDDDIIIKYDWNKDGKYDHKNDINGPRTQWLTSFGVGLGYKF